MVSFTQSSLVQNGTGDSAPALVFPLADISVQAGGSFEYTAPANTFSDPDGDLLTLSATLSDGSALPAWLVFDPVLGAFSGAPLTGGDFDIMLIATDPFGLSCCDVFRITVTAPAGQHITGSTGDDVLTGGQYDDSLLGLAGDDSLSGGAGDDWMEGGAGNDRMDGGAGIDTVVYASATQGVQVTLDTTRTQNTHGAGRDTILNVENLTGSAFGDTLEGDGRANVLRGEGGADTLRGGGGSDDLWGGLGADTFAFGASSDSAVTARDSIFDFNRAEGDRIDLSDIDAIPGGKNNAFTLVTAFTHAAGQLVVTEEAGHYVVQGDLNGDGVADFAINVYSATGLGPPDFIL